MKTTVRIILAIAISTYSSALYAQRKEIDVKHYTFNLSLYDSTDAIQGRAEITLAAKEAVNQISLDLMNKNASGKGMQVRSVTANEKSLKFSQQDHKLLIILNENIQPLQNITLTIVYSGIPDDGLIISKNKFGDRTFFGDNWPDRAHHWLPTIDHPSDKASVDFIVTAPLHYEVIGNGIKLEESTINTRQKLTHWHEAVNIPTKVMVIGAARFAIQYAGEVNDIPVEQWVYPQNKAEGFHDYAAAKKILDFFISHIGPYPYEKLANVQSKTKYGGMENASNIFYMESSVDGKASHDNLLAHEIAHQWFGNSASEQDWHHVWLSEGFATYFTHIYNEFTYGNDKRAAAMADDRQTVIDFYKSNPLPVVFKTLPGNLLEILSANSYQKGGWILHMLRKEIGDDAFWLGVRTYYSRFQHSNAQTSDLQKIMEEASGKNLNTFFNQWLYNEGHPVLTGKWTYDSKSKKLNVIIEQTQKNLFNFNLELGIYQKDNFQPAVEKLKISQKSQSFSIPVDFVPERIALDPGVNLLFEGKLQND